MVPLAITLEPDEGGGWVYVSLWVDVEIGMGDARITIEVLPRMALTRCSMS